MGVFDSFGGLKGLLGQVELYQKQQFLTPYARA